MNKVIILLGPTGVGKTKVSILLAKALKTEIISADSMLVYRHMDIGTAKPSAGELKSVPHHLINILMPDEKFSAGLFKEKATVIIDELHDKNKIPLVVGGTGLYIRALTKGLFKGPDADESLRRELRSEEKAHGSGYLYRRLKRLDPESANRIEQNDLRRIIRALEVSLKADRGISEIQKESTEHSGYDFIKIGLFRDRKELYGMIEERVDKMIDEGLLEETRSLIKMNPGRTALQALGYKEMKLYLDGQAGLEEAVRLIKKRTRMYAKRQHTWFRKEPYVNRVDISGIIEAEKIFAKIRNDVKMLFTFCGLT
jgi:tRNA dimethylallyltransferase